MLQNGGPETGKDKLDKPSSPYDPVKKEENPMGQANGIVQNGIDDKWGIRLC